MRNVQRTIEGMKLSIKIFEHCCAYHWEFLLIFQWGVNTFRRGVQHISLRVSTYFSMGYEHFCDEGYKTYHWEFLLIFQWGVNTFRALLCISLRVSTYFSMGCEHFCDEGYKTYHWEFLLIFQWGVNTFRQGVQNYWTVLNCNPP